MGISDSESFTSSESSDERILYSFDEELAGIGQARWEELQREAGNNISQDNLVTAMKSSQIKHQDLLDEVKVLRAENSALLAQSSTGKPKPSSSPEEKEIQYAGERFAFGNELFFDGAVIDKPFLPGINLSHPDRYADNDTRDEVALAELYASISPALQAMLSTPSSRGSFAELFIQHHKNERGQLVFLARELAGDLLAARDDKGNALSAHNIASSNAFGISAGTALVVKNAKSTLRGGNVELRKLLHDPDKSGDTYPALAPLLFPGGNCKDITRLFQVESLARYLRAILFGKSSILPGNEPGGKRKPKSVLWGVKETTPGMIASAATILTFICGPDLIFHQKGAVTGVDWKMRSSQYKYIIVSLPDAHRTKLLAWYDNIVFANSTTSASSANMETSNRIQTREIDDLISQLRNADVEGSSASPAPSPSLNSDVPSAIRLSSPDPSFVPPSQPCAAPRALPPQSGPAFEPESEGVNPFSFVTGPVDFVPDNTAAPKARKVRAKKTKTSGGQPEILPAFPGPTRRVSTRKPKAT